MIEFKITNHAILDVEVVEIYVDGIMRGCLYPQEPTAVRLISRYFDGDPEPELGEPAAWRFAFRES